MASKLAQQIPDLKLWVYEALNYVFNNYPVSSNNAFQIRESDQLVEGDVYHPYTSTGDRTPNFVRDEFRWKNAKWIIFNGQNIALAQSKPHGIIKIMNVNKKNRYVRNMFIINLHDNFPKIKVYYE